MKNSNWPKPILFRNVRQRLWHAIIPCPIYHLLLHLPHPLPLVSTYFHLLPLPCHIMLGSGYICPGTVSGRCGGCCQPYLSQLSHPKTSLGWMCSWGCLCFHVVFHHWLPPHPWMGQLDARLLCSSTIACPGSYSKWRFCWRWMAAMEIETEIKQWW